MKKLIPLLLILSFNFINAQQDNFALFLNIGRASDNDAIGNFGGGGGGLQVWKAGPIFRLGTEYKLNKSFSAQGFVSYSFYKYDGSRSYGEKSSDGYNNIFDIMGNIKWKIGIFNMNLGVGISTQFNDDIRYLEETQYHHASVFINSKNKTVFAGQFGLGFDIHIYDRFSIQSEGDLFFREYLGSAWLLGIKYSIDKI
ncbi:MAG: hypothetical protein IT276_11715 [Ignavibacteriaceae bacterium]|nr:hypothetical protein [Ignavibacterium sp.]MCC6255574.1 hypothetical protein [Ignavibacteriaceae bacterium]HRN25964.1 hypothetical protein [Ignavibacteriaceae bacterium]HRP93358.1 hypothetical protein [Ignavibacteriaceae bacterium]HRQ54234.1 hypothetical protein [Ignavibacteriaceae bacterium]